MFGLFRPLFLSCPYVLAHSLPLPIPFVAFKSQKVQFLRYTYGTCCFVDTKKFKPANLLKT
jgi:hypothetical protein